MDRRERARSFCIESGARGDDEPFPACEAGRCVLLTGNEKFTTRGSAKSDRFEFEPPDACMNRLRASVDRDGALVRWTFILEPGR